MTKRVLVTKVALVALGLMGSGCIPADAAPGLHSGDRSYVTTPASGANAQGQKNKQRSTTNAGLAVYNTGRCNYPDVSVADRRAPAGDCVNTFQVGAGHAAHGTDAVPAAQEH